jgi:hypothetical protein
MFVSHFCPLGELLVLLNAKTVLLRQDTFEFRQLLRRISPNDDGAFIQPLMPADFLFVLVSRRGQGWIAARLLWLSDHLAL